MRILPRLALAATAAAVVGTALLQTGASAAAPASQTDAPVTSSIGSSINTADDTARVSGMLGRQLTTARVFMYTPPATWAKSSTLNSLPGNATVVLSFQGGTPTQIQSFLASRPTGTTCYATYYHEPEDNFTTPAQIAAYHASWDAYAPAIRAAGCIPTMILMKWSLNPKSGRNWLNYYYPDDMDVIAFDAYNTALNRGYYSDPTKYLAPILAASAQVGKPWGLAEVGSFSLDDPSLRAQWAHGVATTSSTDGALFSVWWDHPSFDGKKDFSLDAATASAWNNNT